MYVNSLKLSSEEALRIMTLYEHSKFIRSVIKNGSSVGTVTVSLTTGYPGLFGVSTGDTLDNSEITAP